MRYTALYGLVEKYAELAMRAHEWYTDLDNEQCAMPGTFAVLMLVMKDKKYFSLFEKYLRFVDEEHQKIHTKITPLFMQKYCLTDETLPLFIYTEMFSKDENMHALEQYRGKLRIFLNAEDDSEEPEDNEGLEECLWEALQYTIWGKKQKGRKPS